MKIRDAIRRTIASNIKRARIAAHMTQAEAADELGITAQAISNFERGVNGIENSLLLRMCAIYNTSMSSILGEDDDQKEKVPTTPGERDLLDEVDVAFYGNYKELSEDDKETLREMARVMRERRTKKNQEK